jgi:hypothetical protein
MDWHQKGHSRRPVFAAWQAHWSVISWFSGNRYTKTAWSCASSCEAEVVLHHDGAPSALWGTISTVAECDMSRKFGRRRPIAWSPWSSGLIPMYLFLWGHMTEYSLFRTTYDPASRLQAALTTVDDNMLRHVKKMPCSVLPAALKWTEAASKNSCNYCTMRPSLDSLCHLTVTCILQLKRQRTYITQYFRLVLTSNHTL